jgi:hypothetical protein
VQSLRNETLVCTEKLKNPSRTIGKCQPLEAHRSKFERRINLTIYTAVIRALVSVTVFLCLTTRLDSEAAEEDSELEDSKKDFKPVASVTSGNKPDRRN